MSMKPLLIAAALAVLVPVSGAEANNTKGAVKGAAPRSSAPASAPSNNGNNGNRGNGGGRLDIEVCNRSDDNASVALSFMEVGENRFINRGWFTVRAGRCEVLATTGNATFYAYADVEGTDRAWEGNHSLCVQYPGPYTFYTSGEYCAEGQVTRKFTVMTASEAGKYTWNLDP